MMTPEGSLTRESDNARMAETQRELDDAIKAVTTDPVNRPAHYTSGNIECIDALEAALTPEEFRGFCKGNALKYVWRAGKKNLEVEDLRKAIWYLDRVTQVPWCGDSCVSREACQCPASVRSKA